MKQAFFLLVFLFMPAVQAATHALSSEQWAVPRRAEVILDMPPIRKAVREMQQTPGSRLILHYPGGDSGTLWVQELRSWLVSLGVPTTAIEITPGSQHQQVIELEVVTPVVFRNGTENR